jgi:ribosome-binding factor A
MSFPFDSPISNIKRAQREERCYRIISELYEQASLDDPRLREFVITRVQIAADKSTCYVNFFSQLGQEKFNEMLHTILKLYKPSMRKALANRLASRYVPDLRFVFDSQMEKQISLEALLSKVQESESESEQELESESEIENSEEGNIQE